MKKNLLVLFGISLFALTLGACTNSRGNTPSSQPDSGEVKQSYTVAFEVDGTRVATARVKDGEKVTQQIDDPVKTGYVFIQNEVIDEYIWSYLFRQLITIAVNQNLNILFLE